VATPRGQNFELGPNIFVRVPDGTPAASLVSATKMGCCGRCLLRGRPSPAGGDGHGQEDDG
jgi:hypothetical protein